MAKWEVPQFARGHPRYVYLYWVLVLGAGSYYSVDYLYRRMTAKAPAPPKQLSLDSLSEEQLERLKAQRRAQTAKNAT